MEVNKKELKEQEIRTLFITPALQRKGWAVSVNMREEYYFTDGRVVLVIVTTKNNRISQSGLFQFPLFHKFLFLLLYLFKQFLGSAFFGNLWCKLTLDSFLKNRFL